MAAEQRLALFDTVIPRHQPVTDHARYGLPTVWLRPASTVAVAYRELADEVVGRLADLDATARAADDGSTPARRRARAMSRPPTPRALPTRSAAPARPRRHGRADPFGAPSTGPTPRLRELPLDAIAPNRDQPRKRFDAAALERLADSMRERGVLQPVLVRPLGGERFELIAGERRWRAAQLAGLTAIPAYVRADTDDAAALELALIENAAREDLTPVEEARTLSTLIDDLGLTQAALAKRIGRSRSDLANTLRLLDLPDDVLDLIADGRLSKGHGKSLLARPGRRRDAASSRDAPSSSGWSVRQLERAIAASARHAGPAARTADDRSALARSLTERAASSVDVPVDVRPRAGGFTIRLVAADLATAENVLERLAVSHDQLS